MDLIKPNKEKIRLFIIIILASLITAVLFMFLSRFWAVSYYLRGDHLYYVIGFFVAGILRYLLLAYLIVSFYKKKFSPKGEYYSIFKIVMLLWAFSFLHRSVLGYVWQIAPEIFFANLINIEFFAVSLFWYYLLACAIYYFNEIKTH